MTMALTLAVEFGWLMANPQREAGCLPGPNPALGRRSAGTRARAAAAFEGRPGRFALGTYTWQVRLPQSTMAQAKVPGHVASKLHRADHVQHSVLQSRMV